MWNRFEGDEEVWPSRSGMVMKALLSIRKEIMPDGSWSILVSKDDKNPLEWDTHTRCLISIEYACPSRASTRIRVGHVVQILRDHTRCNSICQTISLESRSVKGKNEAEIYPYMTTANHSNPPSNSKIPTPPASRTPAPALRTIACTTLCSHH